MSLTTVAAVAAILGVDPGDLTADQTDRITELIDLAASEIDGALGRPAEGGDPVTEELTADPWRTEVLLSRWPIDPDGDVTVVEAGTTLDADTYTLDPATGILRRLEGDYRIRWAAATNGITVTYAPATIPALAALAARIAARAYNAGNAAASVPAIMGGLRQLTIGRWSATRDTGAAGGGVPGEALALTEADLAIIDRWTDRRP